jgi:hypothetical protein
VPDQLDQACVAVGTEARGDAPLGERPQRLRDATVAARLAPRSTTAAAFSGDRFQTVVGWPSFRNSPASAEPIGPSPMTVTGDRAVSTIETPGKNEGVRYFACPGSRLENPDGD